MLAALSRPLLCLACLLLLQNAWAYADEAVKVQVVQDGQAVVVDMHMHSIASVREAWSVLTDFAHMPSFVPNLKSSKVLETHGNLLKVQQQGSAKHGWLSFDFESLREIELIPYEQINSHSIGGSVSQMNGVTRLVADASGTDIQFHSRSIPGFWVPPVIGLEFVRHEVAEQFRAMLEEMERRKFLRP